MSTFERNNISIHYEIIEGAVPTDTIFLHGNLASNAWWKPAAKIWQSRNQNLPGRLILAEWQGCGKSTGPREEKDLAPENLATDFTALLEAIGSKKANLVAHSTGGLIGLIAMAQRPELFNRAVLLDPVSHLGVQFGPEMFEAFTRMSQDRGFCELIILSTAHQAQLSDELKKQIVDDAFGVHPLIWHGVPRALNDIDISSQLPAIQQPVLILHGEHDTLLPKERSRELAELLPNGKFYEIPGRGHSTNVENPGLFVEIVDSFLFG